MGFFSPWEMIGAPTGSDVASIGIAAAGTQERVRPIRGVVFLDRWSSYQQRGQIGPNGKRNYYAASVGPGRAACCRVFRGSVGDYSKSPVGDL